MNKIDKPCFVLADSCALVQTWKNFRFEQVRLDGRGSRGGDANLPRLDEQEEGLTCVCLCTNQPWFPTWNGMGNVFAALVV